jgi:hypothetical protein
LIKRGKGGVRLTFSLVFGRMSVEGMHNNQSVPTNDGQINIGGNHFLYISTLTLSSFHPIVSLC